MSKTCPICSCENIVKLRNYKNSNHNFDNLYLFVCNNCKLVFVNPMPSDEILFEFNASYFESAHGGQRLDISSTAFYSGISKLRATYLDTFLKFNNITSNKILEIGPGPGYFAKNWLIKYPETEYFAIETDESCYKSLNKIGLTIINDSQYENIANSCDVVIMSHVLEHVSKPKDFIAFATRFLKKGGVLFIEVPCNDWEHKTLDEPHLLFFDKKSMNDLLHISGLYNVNTSYYGQLIKNLKNKSFIKNKMLSIRIKIINLGFGKLFGSSVIGMESIENPIERAVLKPFCAHVESNEPTWWLRAIAIKK